MHRQDLKTEPARSRWPFLFEKYWQCILRFGLPFVVLYYGIHYAAFRIAMRHYPATYPWEHVILSACIVMLVISLVWWLLVREIRSYRRKNEEARSAARSKWPFVFATYWQCLLRFGLLFGSLYYGINYTIFRVATRHHPTSYHWGGAILPAAVAMLLGSLVWWFIMRELIANSRKREQPTNEGRSLS